MVSQDCPEIKALGVGTALCPRVAEKPGCIEPLRNIHCHMWPNIERRGCNLQQLHSVQACMSTPNQIYYSCLNYRGQERHFPNHTIWPVNGIQAENSWILKEAGFSRMGRQSENRSGSSLAYDSALWQM